MPKKITKPGDRRTSIDRRVVRTRKSLQDALISLIHKREYDTISVDDICKAADVGRSTFYTHYAGKDELKRSGLEILHKELRERQHLAQKTETRGFNFTLALFEHAKERIDHFRALAGNRGGAIARSEIQNILTKLVRSELTRRPDETQTDAFQREATIQFTVGALQSLLRWWLENGAKQSPQEIDDAFQRLIGNGVAPK